MDRQTDTTGNITFPQNQFKSHSVSLSLMLGLNVTGINQSSPEADPGFPRGGSTNSKGGYEELLLSQIFPKYCMKLKEFGPRGGGACH